MKTVLAITLGIIFYASMMSKQMKKYMIEERIIKNDILIENFRKADFSRKW